MKWLVATAFAIFAISATVWSCRYAPWVAQPQARPYTAKVVRRVQAADDVKKLNARIVPESLNTSATGPVETPPPIAKQAPFPKLAANARTGYEFGTMMVNTEGRHTWRIENKGEGPLLIAKGPVECSCLVSSLSADEIPPGGFAEIELTWKPPAPDSEFQQIGHLLDERSKVGATPLQRGWTSSPACGDRAGQMERGLVTDEREGKAVGTLTSEVYDQFKIVSVQPSRSQRASRLQTDRQRRAEACGHPRRIRVHGDGREGNSIGPVAFDAADLHDAERGQSD